MKTVNPSQFPAYEDFRANYFRHHAFIPKHSLYRVGEKTSRRSKRRAGTLALEIVTLVFVAVLTGIVI